MAEIKALIRRAPLFGRRRDRAPDALRTSPQSQNSALPSPIAALPPPYSPQDPRLSHCQAPPSHSFEPLLPPPSPISETTPRRSSLQWTQRRASRSPSPGRPVHDSTTNTRRASTPSLTPVAPQPRPAAPHHPPVQFHSAASPPYTPAPGREHLADRLGYVTAAESSRRATSAQPQAPPPRKVKPHISSLPLGLLHHILTLTLDPTVTPAQDPYLDRELEPYLRQYALLKMRGVDRRFFLAATSILRDRMIPIYISLLPFGTSSDPHPPGGDSQNPTKGSVFAHRSRETAILDRFIAVRVGEDLRKAESSLSQDSGSQALIFSTLQPAARLEDLLLALPANLIAPKANTRGDLFKSLPLPWPHLLIQSTPLWTSLYVSQARVDLPHGSSFWNTPRKTLVVEVRRRATVEDTLDKLREALEHVRRGWREWGEKVG